jgi:hypothetical protein
VDALRQPFPDSVRQTAIFTKNDGIVDWNYCVNDDPEADVEVSGSHVGLVFNANVYRHIAERLAEAADTNRRMTTTPGDRGKRR